MKHRISTGSRWKEQKDIADCGLGSAGSSHLLPGVCRGSEAGSEDLAGPATSKLLHCGLFTWQNKLTYFRMLHTFTSQFTSKLGK